MNRIRNEKHNKSSRFVLEKWACDIKPLSESFHYQSQWVTHMYHMYSRRR